MWVYWDSVSRIEITIEIRYFVCNKHPTYISNSRKWLTCIRIRTLMLLFRKKPDGTGFNIRMNVKMLYMTYRYSLQLPQKKYIQFHVWYRNRYLQWGITTYFLMNNFPEHCYWMLHSIWTPSLEWGRLR